jgi:lipid A 3-O-deacylase
VEKIQMEGIRGGVLAICVVAMNVVVSAQTPLSSMAASLPVTQLANSTPWEYGIQAQGGNGLQDRTNFRFLMVGGHLGKVLTPQLGRGLLRGNFEYAVEVFPLWQSYTPRFQRINCVPASPKVACTPPYTVGGTYTGASITPIQMRWNFSRAKRFMPWVQAAGGVIWTNHKYPAVGDLNAADPTQTGPGADTSVWNFSPQGGIGAHYFFRSRRSVDFGVNGVHISSASLGDKNPGVNASLQISVGFTWWK